MHSCTRFGKERWGGGFANAYPFFCLAICLPGFMVCVKAESVFNFPSMKLKGNTAEGTWVSEQAKDYPSCVCVKSLQVLQSTALKGFAAIGV